MKFPLTKTGYVLAILLGLEIIAGLSSHLVLFLTHPTWVSDGQYGMSISYLAGCGFFGGIGVVLLIRYFNKRIDTFANTALEILILYCIALLAIVIALEYAKLGKSGAIEHTIMMTLCFLISPIIATLALFQPLSLVVPTSALLPYVLIIATVYLYLRAKVK